MLATCASIILSFQLSIFNCAQAQYTVKHLERPYNTTGSETGAIRVGDTIMAFSAMPPEKSGGKMCKAKTWGIPANACILCA